MIRGGRREKHKIVQIAVFPIIFVLIVDAAFKRLKNYTIKIFESFYKNQFKSNVDKYKLSQLGLKKIQIDRVCKYIDF